MLMWGGVNTAGIGAAGVILMEILVRYFDGLFCF
jgi:hypothetical protein